MIVQACLNGSRAADAHPALPVSADALWSDARACVAAGAASLHVHARDASGAESLAPLDVAATVAAIGPGTELSLSTGLWITGGDAERRAALVAGWKLVPDLVSLNVSEPGWRQLAVTLRELGVGIEIGLGSLADAREFVSDPIPGVRRALIEVDGDDPVAEAAAMEEAFAEAGFDVPRLHHGYDAATWDVIDAAITLGRDVRIGLEDTLTGPDGSPAAGNAELVRAVAARLS